MSGQFASPERWCDCDDAPIYANGAATVLDHLEDCGFPDDICVKREHRVKVHDRCGRELLMRYCGCGSTGFTRDPDRDWWVDPDCGWPTRAWFEGAGKPAPPELAGIRPTTYHEFAVVPTTPRSTYALLDERGRDINKARAGTWVRD